MNIIDKVTIFMKEYMKNHDGSHDFEHINRVLFNSKLIAASIYYNDPMVELLALLHDYEDDKYKRDDSHSSFQLLKTFLIDECKLELDKVEQLIQWIPLISYSKNMKHITKDNNAILPKVDIPVQIVSDADKLDALGAIGIARCFTYIGHINQSLQSGINHFDDKLFKLQYCMYTDTGKKLAITRTEYMSDFVKLCNIYKPNSL